MSKTNEISTIPVYDLKKNNQYGSAYFVDHTQTVAIHKAIEQMANYFKREFHFDFLQYSAHADIKKCENDITHNYVWIDKNWDGDFIIGIAIFKRMQDANESEEWSLDLVWVHPYYRCRGLLSSTWEAFEHRYGKNFKVAPPLSRAMVGFLKKQKG